MTPSGLDRWQAGAALGLVLFALYLALPYHKTADSRYAFVLSESLLRRGSFALDGFFEPPFEPHLKRWEEARGHRFYCFPPGSSILSMPFVAAMNLAGLSAVTKDQRHDREAEVRMQALLAAAVSALFAVRCLRLARRFLPPGQSLAIFAGVALGSQVLSTTSRTLWSDTWGLLLLVGVIDVLLRLEDGAGRAVPLPPGRQAIWLVALGTLLSWAYFVRPTHAISAAVVAVHVVLLLRWRAVPLAATGLAWLSLFVFTSLKTLGAPLPAYYRSNRLEFKEFGTALAANLLSPSRGLLVYVPVLLFCGLLLVRHRRRLLHRRLVVVALAVSTLHLVLISGYWQWWAGHSYGPRFTAGLLPWLALLAILSLRAWSDARREAELTPARWRAESYAGMALLVLSVLVNVPGTLQSAEAWNRGTPDIDAAPRRVFDWRDPQFLSSFTRR